FRGITPEALQILVDADWPGNVRQLRNLIESMVVLAPEGEIRADDIPRDIRERGRGLPMRLVGATRDVAGQELEFIFRSLVELKLQVEELRRRLEERPQRVEVIEVGPGSALSPSAPVDTEPAAEPEVLYRPGMTMAEVERVAIEAALRETKGNRRKAAEVLGIGERTLYRKLKEYALASVTLCQRVVGRAAIDWRSGRVHVWAPLSAPVPGDAAPQPAVPWTLKSIPTPASPAWRACGCARQTLWPSRARWCISWMSRARAAGCACRPVRTTRSRSRATCRAPSSSPCPAAPR